MTTTQQQQRMKTTFEALTAYEAQRETFIEQEAYRYVFNRTAEAGCERIVCDNLHQASRIYNERKDKPDQIEPRVSSINLVYGKPDQKKATAAATALYTQRLKRFSDDFQEARALYIKAQEAVEQAAVQAAQKAQSDADLTAQMLAH